MSVYIRLKYFIYRCFLSKLSSKNSPNDFRVKMRVWSLKELMCVVGENVNIQPNVTFKGDLRNFSIGNNSGIGMNSSFHLTGKFKIGNDVMIGEHLTVHTSNHGTTMGILLREQVSTISDVEIENDVWIGSNVILLPGVKVCSGAVIGAGSVVTKNVDSNTIVAGNPARFIRFR